MSDLLFTSTGALERALDGSDESFAAYFYAVYHCSPDEDAGINEYRQQLKSAHPDNVTAIGRHFVLFGEPAFQALRSYYFALAQAESLPDNFRAYARERQAAIEDLHRNSQSLPKPIDLSEGQLSEDKVLDFYACLALSNGQIVHRSMVS